MKKNKVCKPLDKCAKSDKNHQGNYEISISFDLYGESNDGDKCVAELERNILEQFQVWVKNMRENPVNNYKIKNIILNNVI